MDLRVDRKKRIRISEQEYLNLTLGQLISQKFELFNDINFQIKLICNPQLSGSTTSIQGNCCTIELCQFDLDKMVNGSDKKSGVEVANFVIQVDIFSEKKRGALSSYGTN